MWWQVLPPLGIIGGCMAVQFTGMGLSHYIFLGTPSFRNLSQSTHHSNCQYLAYRRDTFNLGNNYESRGLDYITDE